MCSHRRATSLWWTPPTVRARGLPRRWYSRGVDDLSLEPMIPSEFELLKTGLIERFATEQIEAGNWKPEDALRMSLAEINRLLPRGLDTAGVLLLSARTTDGSTVGHVWMAIEPRPSAAGEAWIYDIEIVEGRRGQGFGRRLLGAAEAAAARHGATWLGLNVFGSNDAARQLYSSSGYEIKALQLRKRL